MRSYWTTAQADAAKDCADPALTENDGACAAYVAISARLGSVDEAIAFASNYLQPRDMPYYICRYEPAPSEECSEEDTREFFDFGSAIKFALEVYRYPMQHQ